MELQLIEENYNFLRLDKNFAHNSTDFKRIFGKDALLVKALLVYFSETLQNNLFGYGSLDPTEFAEDLGLTANNLRAKVSDVKDIAQFRDMSEDEIKYRYELQEQNPNDPRFRIFDSVLENALYRLRYDSIKYSNKAQYYTTQGEDYVKIDLQEVRFIDELSIIFKNKGRGKKKVFYNYALNPAFINNLSNYYVNSKKESIKRLRKPNLDDLYLYVVNLQTTFALKGITKDFSDFNFLCKKADINITKPADRKLKLNKAFQKLNKDTEINVQLNWSAKPGTRYKYLPEIEFTEEDLKRIRENNSSDERKKTFKFNLDYELTQAYRREKFNSDMGQIIDRTDFLNWLKKLAISESTQSQSKGQFEIFNTYFKMAIVKTYGDIPNWYFQTVKKFMNALRVAERYEDAFNFNIDVNKN